MSFCIKPGFMIRRERVWDVGIKPKDRVRVYKLRYDPDGFEHATQYGRTGVIRYPWDAMKDGDFFYAPINSRSKNAMEVGFRQAAARHDIEIAIHPGTNEHGVEVYRVTRVYTGIHKAKRIARGFGKSAPSHDVEGRREAGRLAARGQSRDARPRGGAHVPATPADTLPPPSGPTDEGYDRAARMAAVRAAAMEELNAG